MVDRRKLGVALLAAGASRRFGDQDKLAQMFRGRRLGEHAAVAVPMQSFDQAWVVGAHRGHACEGAWQDCGFEIVVNPNAADGMGTSVALAARLAIKAGHDALLIALADMPFVPREHFSALIDAVATSSAIAASATDSSRLPPAVFGRDHFGALASATGDTGARAILSQGQVIACPREWLIDIDTPQSLQKYDG